MLLHYFVDEGNIPLKLSATVGLRGRASATFPTLTNNAYHQGQTDTGRQGITYACESGTTEIILDFSRPKGTFLTGLPRTSLSSFAVAIGVHSVPGSWELEPLKFLVGTLPFYFITTITTITTLGRKQALKNSRNPSRLLPLRRVAFSRVGDILAVYRVR